MSISHGPLTQATTQLKHMLPLLPRAEPAMCPTGAEREGLLHHRLPWFWVRLCHHRPLTQKWREAPWLHTADTNRTKNISVSLHFWRSSNGKTSPHDARMLAAPYYTKSWPAMWTAMQNWDPHTLTHAYSLELPTGSSVSPHQRRSVNPITTHSSLAQCLTGTAFLSPPGWSSPAEYG